MKIDDVRKRAFAMDVSSALVSSFSPSSGKNRHFTRVVLSFLSMNLKVWMPKKALFA